MTEIPTPAQPLTGQEWAEAIDRIEDLWPGTNVWKKGDKLFETFRGFPADLLAAAITHLFDEGRQGAPSPSKVMGEIRRIASEKGVSVQYEGPHEHVLGHIQPFYLLGGVYAGERGPGEEACSVTGCDYVRPCHCEDCKQDRWYTRETRPITVEEREAQDARKVKI